MAQVHQEVELDSAVATESTATWHDSTNMEIEQPPLPPTDTGKAAWLVLAGCSLIQAPVWGISN